jgi:hypothetical protein
MRSYLRFGLLLLGSAMPLVSFGQFQAPSKEELGMTSDPKAPGADAVYLFRDEVSDDPHHFATVYARLKILTEKGKEAATVHVSYARSFVFHATGDNSSRMGSGTSNHWDAPDVNHAGEDMPNDTDSFNVHTDVSAIEARTIHPDGTVVPLTGSPTDLLKVKRGRNQMNEISFTLPSVEVGSILEYRYQIRYDRFDMPPNWEIQKEYFTHRAHFAFTPDEQFSPERNRNAGTAGTADSALRDPHGEAMTDILNTAVLPPGKSVKQEAAGKYSVDLTDIPAFPREAFGPPPANLAYGVRFFYTPTPDVKEFWQKEMAFWTKTLNLYVDPTPSLTQTVAELCSGSVAPIDKAKKLYETVQKLANTDFTFEGEPGIGSQWIPAGHVERVLADKKGTSNQIAYLYLAMARIAGLNARPERIASRSRRIFSANLLSADQLDSVVVALQIDGKEITVDPGTKMAPFETLHWAHAGAGGLAMANGKVETILTPLQKNTDNSVLHVGSVAFKSDGAISGTLKVAFIGQQAILYRQMAIRSGPDAVKDAIEKLIARQVPQGVLAKVDHVAYIDDPSKQLLAVVPVSGELTSNAGSRLMLPRAFFEARETNPFPAEDDRTLPIDMRYPSQEQEQITYELPSGYTVEGKPEDTVMRWEENAAYQLKSKVDANSITTARVLARGFTLLDAKQYVPLRDFYQKVVTADQQQFVLSAAQANKGQ